MKLGIVVYSDDSETGWNAFRFGNFTLAMGDEVNVIFLGKGVEYKSLGTDTFNVTEQLPGVSQWRWQNIYLRHVPGYSPLESSANVYGSNAERPVLDSRTE